MNELLFSDKVGNVHRKPQMQNVRWSFGHSTGALLATAGCLHLQNAWPLVLFFTFSFAALWWRHRSFLKQQHFFAGPANWITVIRFVIIAYVLIFFKLMPLPIVFTLLSIAVMMDVFDGYIARRTNSQSEFGALFDMEVDAFYVLAMGIYFCFTTDFGLWLLIPGGIRYVYDLVRIGFGDEQFVPRRQPLAVFLAGVNFVLLLLALMLPRDLSLLVLLISLCVVSFSFGRSFFDLFRYGLRQNGLR